MTDQLQIVSEDPGDWPGVPGWVRDTALLDAIVAAVVATDTAGTIFYFNRAAERMYGYGRDQMIGANVMHLLVEPVDQRPAEEVMASVLAGQQWSGRWRVRRADGGTSVVRCTDTPIMDGAEVVGVIGVAEELGENSPMGTGTADATVQRALAVAEQMRQAMESRAVIEQAKGMLIGAHGCTPDEAFQMLAKRSQHSNRKVHDIATAMVHGASKGTRPLGSATPPS
jgi:PAS domain S-box-containing protein